MCNSSAYTLLEGFPFLIPLPAVFHQKHYIPLNQVHVDIHHIFDFEQH